IHFGRPVPQAWSLDHLAFNLGSCTIDGRAAVDANTLLTDGALNLSAGNLDDLSALTLTPMAGSLEAAITLTREGGRQNAVVRAHGAAMRRGDLALAQLDAGLTGRDLRQRPVIDGHLNAERLVAAGESLDSVRLTAQGTPSASDIVLKVKAPGFALCGGARPAPGGAYLDRAIPPHSNSGLRALGAHRPRYNYFGRRGGRDQRALDRGRQRPSHLVGPSGPEPRPQARYPRSTPVACPHRRPEPGACRHSRRRRGGAGQRRATGGALCPLGHPPCHARDPQGWSAADRPEAKGEPGGGSGQYRGACLGRARSRDERHRVPAHRSGRCPSAQGAGQSGGRPRQYAP